MVRRAHEPGIRELTGPGSAFLHPGSSSFGLADGGQLERSFVALGRRVRSDLIRLADDLGSGTIGVSGYVNRARATIRTGYFTAYSLGAISIFPFYTITDRDIAVLDRELDEETGFLRKFASDIRSGHLDLNPTRRSGLYLLALRGIFEVGRVAALPAGPFSWKLGDQEHCVSCVEASVDGPYQKTRYSGLGLPELPGAPGDGSVCLGLTRCGCRIVMANGTPLPNQDLADRMRGLLLEVMNGFSGAAPDS